MGLTLTPRSTSDRHAVKSGIVLEISEAKPAGTLSTPKTSRPLDTVVILKLTTKMRVSNDRSWGRRSPRRSASAIRNVPPITVRSAAISNGPA